ncbi:hypothetical protein AVEN_101596-1 [Araneus ventricosus]|uniref:Uncharacterized protein n=1 Tax=Araneus ventricosus TaxID=182803 RepID=A0A4Y2USM6_ARAVE|nr:hypothetical protein AVEN_101596-1 [Araneus ventricosus]
MSCGYRTISCANRGSIEKSGVERLPIFSINFHFSTSCVQEQSFLSQVILERDRVTKDRVAKPFTLTFLPDASRSRWPSGKDPSRRIPGSKPVSTVDLYCIGLVAHSIIRRGSNVFPLVCGAEAWSE